MLSDNSLRQQLEQEIRRSGVIDQGRIDLLVEQALAERERGSPPRGGSVREPSWLTALASDPSQYERAPEPTISDEPPSRGFLGGLQDAFTEYGRTWEDPSYRPPYDTSLARSGFERDVLRLGNSIMRMPQNLYHGYRSTVGAVTDEAGRQFQDYITPGGGRREEEVSPEGVDLSRLLQMTGPQTEEEISVTTTQGPLTGGGGGSFPGIPTPDFGELRAMLERERARAAGEPADFTDLAAMLDGLNPEELSEGRIQEIRRNAILGAISQAAGNIDSTTPVGSMLLQLGLAGAGGGAAADEREETLRRSRRDELRQVAGMRLNLRQMQEDARQRQMDRDQRWGETIINSEMQMQNMAQDAAIAQSNLAIAREELGIRRAQLAQDDVLSLGGGQFAIVRRSPEGRVTVERGDGSTGRQFFSLRGPAAVTALSEIAAQEDSGTLAIGLPLAQSILGNNLLPVFAEALDVEQNELYRDAMQAVGGQHIAEMGGDPTAMIQSAMAVELMRAYSEASPEVQQQILDQWIDLMTEGSYVPQLP